VSERELGLGLSLGLRLEISGENQRGVKSTL